MTSDEGYLVPAETLAKLGGGDVKTGRRVLRMMIDLEVTHAPIPSPTPKPENVRAATTADELSILHLMRLDIAENAAHIAPLSEPRLLEFVQTATRDFKATIGVIGAPGHIEGLIYLTPEQWWWSEEWCLAERVSIVHPAHRGSRHAIDLLRFARWFVEVMRHNPEVQIYLLASVVATKNALAKQVLFGRMLTRIGSVFAHPDPTIR